LYAAMWSVLNNIYTASPLDLGEARPELLMYQALSDFMYKTAEVIGLPSEEELEEMEEEGETSNDLNSLTYSNLPDFYKKQQNLSKVASKPPRTRGNLFSAKSSLSVSDMLASFAISSRYSGFV